MSTQNATPFPELNDLLTEFVGRVHAIPGASVVGSASWARSCPAMVMLRAGTIRRGLRRGFSAA